MEENNFEQPVNPEPAEPVAEQPVNPGPAEPVTEQPVNPEPAAPVAEQPVYTQPATPVVEQPVYTQPVVPVVPTQPEKPKKSKTGLIIAIILVVIAALAVGGFFLFKNLFTSPKQCVAKGVEKLQQEMAARPHPVLDELGMDELAKYYETNAFDFDSSINLKLEEMDDEMFDTFGIDFNVKNDTADEKCAVNLGVSVANVDFLKLETVFADNILYLAMPGMLEDNYSFKIDNAAAFFEKLGVDMSEFEDAMAQMSNTDVSDEEYQKFADGLMAIQSEYEKEFEKTTKYTKKKNVIEVQVSADTLNSYIEDMFEYILNSDLVQDKIDESMEQRKELYNSYYEGEDIEERLKEDREEIVKEMEEDFDISFKDDIVVVYTLDKKGRIVSIATPEMIRIKSDFITGFEVDLAFNGDKYVTDDVEGSIILQFSSGADEKQTLELEIESKTEEEKDVFKQSCVVKIVNNGDSIGKLKSESEWNVKDKEFNCKLLMTAAGQELFKISAKGALSDIKKGQSVKLDIAKMELSVMGQTYATLSGSIGIAPLTEEISTMDAKEITEMDEFELMGILMELEESFEELEDMMY